jgi:hypothetical protein
MLSIARAQRPVHRIMTVAAGKGTLQRRRESVVFGNDLRHCPQPAQNHLVENIITCEKQSALVEITPPTGYMFYVVT